MTEPLLKAREVAELLGVSADWVLDKWQAGELPGFRLGDRPPAPVRFRLSEVEAWLEARRRGPAPRAPRPLQSVSRSLRG